MTHHFAQIYMILKNNVASLFVMAMLLFSAQSYAQTNIGLLAVADQSSGGAGALGPINYNDGIIPPPGCMLGGCAWGWVYDNGWIEYTWSAPQNVAAVKLYMETRQINSCDFEYWNGSAYVKIMSYVRPLGPASEDSIAFPFSVVSTKIRMNNILGSNPNFREIEMYSGKGGQNDGGVASLVTPNAFCPGTYPISVEVRNFGVNQIDSIYVNWELNGTAQPGKWFVGLLDTAGGTGNSYANVFLANQTFAANSVTTLKAWTTLPNNVSDSTNFNDTLLVDMAPSIQGTFTVNGGMITAGTNFANFVDLASFLETNGVCGPVVVNVTPISGGYGQAQFGEILGASAANTITINGNGALITSTGGTTFRGTLTILGSSYLTFRNLIIEGTGTANNYALDIRNNASYVTIDSCTVRVSIAATGNTVAALVVSNNATSIIATGTKPADHLTISNCLIEGGYYGLVYNGATSGTVGQNIVIENNTITDPYMYGVYLRGLENSLIKNNDISRATRTTGSTFYGMFITASVSGTNFNGNIIHNTNDACPTTTVNYTIYSSNAIATAADPAVFSNNVLHDINSTGTLYSLYIAAGDHLHFYHNTISLANHANGPHTGSLRLIYMTGTSGNYVFKNNIFNLSVDGPGIKYIVYNANLNANTIMDYNQYNLESIGGSNYFGYFGNNISDIIGWKGVKNGAFDQNSVYGSPIFNSTNVFTPQSSVGNAAGTNVLAMVPTDIFGTARTTTPDIGAVEYTPLTCLQPLGFSGTSTATAITLNWTNDPGADSVRIEYGLSGFNQGTGTGVNVTGTTFTASGLLSQTCYDFYATTWCNGVAGSGTSVFTYCTQCAPKVVPYFENFDNTPVGTATDPSQPECWYYYNSGGGTNTYGYTYATGAPKSAPRHWSMYNGANNIDTIALISPAIDGLGLGDKRIKFWAKSAAGTYDAPVIIGTVPSPDNMNQLTIMDTLVADASYKEFMLNFSASTGYNGTDQFIVFMYGNLNSGQRVYIDDILFELAPVCAAPIGLDATTITSTSATAIWGTVSGTCFTLEYGPAGFTHSSGQGTVVPNATSPYVMSGLSANTKYDYYVFDCCNPTNPAGPYTFQTKCTYQLSGTYTVGGTPGPNNFANLYDAVTALECGLSGPVTFNIAAGTDTAYIHLKSILGGSATNTLTFNGAGKSLTTILTPPAIPDGITLEGTSYVTFKNLTIDGSNTTRVVWLKENAHHITFDNCNLLHDLNAIQSSTSIIAATSSTTTVTGSGINAQDLVIKDCYLRGSYYAISLNGPNLNTRTSNYRIEGCTFDRPFFYAIRAYYVDSIEVIGNTVNEFAGTGGYGIYAGYVDNFKINSNYFNAKTYAIYITQGNTQSIPTVKSEIINNMIIGNNYAMYGNTVNSVKMYHNTMVGNSYGAYLLANTSVDIRNNIFKGDLYALYSTTAIANAVVDHNIYFSTSSGLAYWGAARANLAVWRTADPTLNANSLAGDPLFLSPTDLHVIGGLANDVAAPGLATVDIDGDIRPAAGSTAPDIGADEFTPVSTDISLLSGSIERSTCMSTNDTVKLTIKNVIGGTKNFATTPLTTVWNIAGPVNSTGTIVTNTGTLALNATLEMMQFTADLSLPGVYTLSAYLQGNADNLLGLNDTIEPVTITVYPAFETIPQTATVTNATDSVELNMTSLFLGSSDFFITEICQYKYNVGEPNVGWPTYLGADDYIEITGVPGTDLAGITLEQWTGVSMISTHTFPIGTLLGPNGTAIIAVGQLGSSVPSPANFYYHGNGSYTGTFGGTTASGRILKDANNDIIDVVGYSSYIFPASSGVTAADWSYPTVVTGSTSGIRLEGPDINTGTNWVVSSTTNRQDPNTVNNLVQVPSPKSVPGFSWSLNGTVIDTAVNIFVGPWATPGVYHYVATLTNSPCGTLTDTVTITVSYAVACPTVTNTSASATNCAGTTLNWTSGTATLSTRIEYGATGFTPGTGTIIAGATSPEVITGLTIASGYDFYIVDSCAAGTSVPVKVFVTTASGPLPTAAATFTVVSVTSSGADVQFDGTASANYTTLTWDFGDLSAPVTGTNPLHTYAANGTYTVTILAEGACGVDTTTLTVVISGVGLLENEIFSHFNIYPNPSLGHFNISFGVEKATSIDISVINLQGQMLYTHNYGITQGSFNEAISLGQIPAGVYLLQIVTNQGTISKRITVGK